MLLAISFQEALTFFHAVKNYFRQCLKISQQHLDYDDTLIFSTVSVSQGELETQKRHHEAKLITTREEEKHKMDKMALELELKWTETLR